MPGSCTDPLDDERAIKVARSIDRTEPGGLRPAARTRGRTPGLQHHNVVSRTTTQNSMRSSAARHDRSRPRDLRAHRRPQMRPDSDHERVRADQRPPPRPGRGGLTRTRRGLRPTDPRPVGPARGRRSGPGSVARVAKPRGSRAHSEGSRRIDLRNRKQRPARGVRPTNERLTYPRPFPRRREFAPRWRASAGGPGCGITASLSDGANGSPIPGHPNSASGAPIRARSLRWRGAE